jgi:hypothetical protein
MDHVELRLDDVPDRRSVEELVRSQVDKLERHCDHITSCLVAIERPNARVRSGSDYRVRIELRVAGLDPFVVRREQGEGAVSSDLATVIRDAFHAADHHMIEASRRRRAD